MRETYVLLPGDEDHEDLEEVDGGMVGDNDHCDDVGVKVVVVS